MIDGKADTEYIAHHDERRDKSQALAVHLAEVAALAEGYAEKIGLPKSAALIGLIHDLGKYSNEFQNYIKSAVGLLDQDVDEEAVDPKEQKGKVDHSTAGAQWVWRELGKQGTEGRVAAQFLSLCIASHHSGLIDCLAPDGTDVFDRRTNKADARTHLEEALSNADRSIRERMSQLATDPGVPKELTSAIKQVAQDQHFFNWGLLLRFLFSTLIDADRTNSAEFEQPHRRRRLGEAPAWLELIDRLENHLSQFTNERPIDGLRKDIALHCLDAAQRERGTYTLTVPTGGGKTLASLRFALHHARKHGMERVIYVIPYTSIIDQNAQVARTVLEPAGTPPGSVVLEHHSNLTPEKDTWRSKTLSENWDAPVIYTTTVQLLETLFAAGTRDVRRLHRLSKAVIVFDEVQTLPIKIFHLFCNAMNFVVERCGSTVLLCTATQPLLHMIDEKKGRLRLGPYNRRAAADHELMPDVRKLFSELERVVVLDRRKQNGWATAEVADLARQCLQELGSCLVVVNTKAMALALYAECGGVASKDLFHLSTHMCPAHRKEVLNKIRARLEPGKEQPTLCISTQLIEAGVDVDFGSAIRSHAGLDSIGQAAGRCNRNGRHAKRPVYVVNPTDEKVDMLEEIKVGQDDLARFMRDYVGNPQEFDNNPLSNAAMERYFTYFFFNRSKAMTYPVEPPRFERTDTLLDVLSHNGKALEEHARIHKSKPGLLLRQSFMGAAKAFRAIDSPAQGVIVPYGEEGRSLINELYAAFDPTKAFKLLRRAQQYSVNVFPHVLRRLQEANAVTEVQEGTGILFLNEQYYDNNTGLSEVPVNNQETLTA
ncbi:MAG: CRISPR-associated endonuclease Cas3'' [Flavobacteriales bacterium]|nr:CRISPR-associated endonuclease Cas3'' [Flavobacteriales bacterium]